MIDNDSSVVNLIEPDIASARRSAMMAHSIVAKFQSMGLPDDLYEDLAKLSTALGDLWGAQKALSDNLEGLLESPADWGNIGDYLVDLRATIDHIRWHVGSVRKPMNRITQNAYSRANDPKNGLNGRGKK